MRTFRVQVVPLLCAAAIILASGSVFYTSRTNAKQDNAAVARNTQLTSCLSRLAVQITTNTAMRSEAAERRDESLLASKRALRELIRLRVIEQVSDSAQVRQVANQYMVQTQKFIEASEDLEKARAANPPPEFKDYCPKVSGTGPEKAPKPEAAQE